MKSCLIIVMVIFSLMSHPLRAEEIRPVVKVRPLLIEGLGAEEGRIIEALILSYITTLGMIVSPEDESGESLESGYILSGRVTLEQDTRMLVLEINGPLIDGTAYSSEYKTTGEMALKVRAMIESVFAGAGPGHVQERAAEFLSEGKIAGTWRGDTGIEVIRLLRGGRGFAIFSSGVRMDLRYSIENNRLQVVQSSSNTERFYHPLPYSVAKELAAAAEPMRWELALYENGASLRGVKITTAVRYEGDTVLEIAPGFTRDAEWVRSSPNN